VSAVYVDMSMSLDGFIAGPNDDVDALHAWMYDLKAFREPHGEAGGTTNQDSEILDEAKQQFLAAGLVDEIQVHIVPILLGRGIRLFDELQPSPVKLRTTRVVESPAVTHLRYRVLR
jgi:hypothetical protein